MIGVTQKERGKVGGSSTLPLSFCVGFPIVWAGYSFRARACLKSHSCKLQAPLCGIFHPNSVDVASQAASFCGNCARMMAPNIITQPMISRWLSFWPRMIQPARTEMQDSRLRIREATVGFMFFCPMI